jgi:predicted phage terminase large subunit-like protein
MPRRRFKRVDTSRALCERSLSDFTRQAWHIIEPTTPLIWNWHLSTLCAYLEAFFQGRVKRLILNVPPGSLKSVLVSVMGPAWKWANDPSARMINLTNEIGLATRDSLRMKHVVQSDWYQARWGDKVILSGDQSEKMHFENTARGFRQGLGFGGSITGKRGSLLLIDDALDAKKAFSDIQCQSVNDTYDQAVSSRLNDPQNDGICLIMQRLRTSDLTGHLIAKKATSWVHVKIPMEYEGEPGFNPVRDLGPHAAEFADPRTEIGELFFPQRFTPAVVRAMKEDLSEYGYAGQAQQRPSPLAGGILKPAQWRIWPDDKPLPKIIHAFASWDTAFTERDFEGSAYSANTLWGVWFDESDIPRDYDPRSRAPAGRHKLILLCAWWGRVDYPDLIVKAREVEEAKLKHERDAHLIEAKASGLSMLQTMRRRTKVRVLSYDPARDGGGDKIARAFFVQPMLSAGMIYAPNRPWAHEVIRIVGEFPAGDALSKDLTDTCTQAWSYLQKGWWIKHPDDDLPANIRPDLTDDDDRDDDLASQLPARRRAYG